MDLLALADFNEVARHGGFGRAARITGRPKATLSRRVRQLEMKREDLPGYRDGSDPWIKDPPPDKDAKGKAKTAKARTKSADTASDSDTAGSK